MVYDKAVNKRFVKSRWLVFILCIALCTGSIPVQAHASGMESAGIEDAGHAASAEDNPVSDDRNDTDPGAVSGNDTDDTGNATDGTEDSADGAEDFTDDTEDPAGGTEDSDRTDGGDNPEDEVPPSNDSDTDAAPPAISDNDLDSVSGNNLRSVSENTLDDDLKVRIDAAEKAFGRLLAGKDMMALLYHADTYSARREPKEHSESAATLETGQTLYIRGVRITEEDVWYETQFFVNGAEGTGYVQSYYLAYADEEWLLWEKEYLLPILESGEDYGFSAYGMSSYSRMPYAIDTSDITAFPGAYQSALRSLKNAHPNWTFVPMDTGLDFNTAVSGEMGDRSLIQNTTNNTSKGWVGDPCPRESGWNYATRSAVAYHMDPRNFLTETYIFQFEQLTFNSSYHTRSAVQTFLNGTFMKGVLPDDPARRTYAQAFYEIGEGRRLSPIHLASRVYQEQGQGNSGLISGTYPGYEGYYNFFNVNVSGSSDAEKITRGLDYAKKQKWDTRYKSLEGGAATIGKNYILKYQDTIYLEKFNVDRNSPYGVYNHQYMQNIQAPASESSSTRKMYANAGSLDSAFVFKIPVYDNMPDEDAYPTLTLNKSSMTLDWSEEKDRENGQQLKLYADGIEINPSEASWKSSDTSLVTVQADGLVKLAEPEDGDPRKTGEAVITAGYQEVEISCKVKVVITLQEIELDRTELILRRPDTVVEDTTGLSAEEKAENTDEAFLQITFDPEDTTSDRTITWTSSDTKVVKVTADPSSTADVPKAVVTAVGKGTARITAKASKAGIPVKTAACDVTVKAPVYRIELTNPNAGNTEIPDQTTLLAGQGINLAAEYWPKDTTSDTQVLWSSSDEKIARVTNGRVEALSRGRAVITARVAGCEQGYTAAHTVVVEECKVVFRKADGSGVLDQQTVRYGARLSGEDFPVAEEVPDSLFIGWYTGENGTGKRFDETTVIYQQETVLYPYYEEQGKGFYVLPVGDQIYTGSAVKPVVHVYDSVSGQDGSRELIRLELNKDYTVSYKNNKNVNTEGKTAPQIIVKGKGNYSGTKSVYFNILPKALTDTDITAENITAAYSGKTIKSAPAVYHDGRKLRKNTDYTVVYPQTGTGAYQTAGTYPIKITGKGGYTGTITVYETITQKVLMSKVTIAKIPNQTYSNDLIDKGNGIVPKESLQVTYKKVPLRESTDGGATGDYVVSYQNNTAVGTATATITAVKGSGYDGSKSVTYKIVGTSIAKAKAEGLEEKEYTGREEDVKQTPGSYRLILNDRELIESTDGGVTGDYLVSYSSITRAGTAKILFTGINEYTGKVTKTYKITKCRLNSGESGINPAFTMQYYTQDASDLPDHRRTITDLSQITTPYVKGGSKPVVVLNFNGKELVQGQDYTVKYSNHNMVATPSDSEAQAGSKLPTITVTGRGNFQGTITGFFEITDGQMAQDNGKLIMTAKDVVYKNKKNAYKGTVTLTDCNGVKLSAGKDYDRNLAYTYAEDAYVYGETDGSDGNKSGTENVRNMKTKEYDDGVIFRRAGSAVEADDIPTAGTVIRVTAHGTGFYAGDGDAAISAVYRIVQADISRARVKVQAKNYQNGHPVTLTEEDLQLTISGSAEPLQYGVDYTIDGSTYAKNRNKGKATVILRGLGNYGGEKKVTFTIGAKLLVW